jgi:hypothetical protein
MEGLQQAESNVVRMDHRRKVSLRFKAIRMIDVIVDLMYCEAVKLKMQKMGYSIEPEDIEISKKSSKEKLMERHLEGKATKELSGVISKLKGIIIELKKDMTALTLNMPEVRHGHTEPEPGQHVDGSSPDTAYDEFGSSEREGFEP